MTGASRAHLPALAGVAATVVAAQEAPGSIFNLATCCSDQTQTSALSRQPAKQKQQSPKGISIHPISQPVKVKMLAPVGKGFGCFWYQSIRPNLYHESSVVGLLSHGVPHGSLVS